MLQTTIEAGKVIKWIDKHYHKTCRLCYRVDYFIVPQGVQKIVLMLHHCITDTAILLLSKSLSIIWSGCRRYVGLGTVLCVDAISLKPVTFIKINCYWLVTQYWSRTLFLLKVLLEVLRSAVTVAWHVLVPLLFPVYVRVVAKEIAYRLKS